MFSTVASIGLGVAGSLIGAASEAEAAQQSADISAKNKKIAEDNAQRALILAQEEQFDTDMETLALLGEQEAIQAGSGLSLSSESFVQTRAQARELGRIDALNVREAGEIRAAAYRNESDAYAAEMVAAQRAKGNAIVGGWLGVGTSIIGGASKLVSAAPTRTKSGMKVPGTVMLT
jgi:predicted secreted protein